jgi:hypothetical protein
MHMGVSTGFEPEPVIHRGKAYPSNLALVMPYGREADGQWEVVGSADMRGDLSYEFDQVTVFRHKFFGGLLIAHDSGCSCPTPFEDHSVKAGQFLNSLVEFDAFVDEHAGTHSRYDEATQDYAEVRHTTTVDQVARLRKVLEEAIPAQPTYLDEAPTGLIDGPTLAGQQTFVEE